jgi:hypothetical protein
VAFESATRAWTLSLRVHRRVTVTPAGDGLRQPRTPARSESRSEQPEVARGCSAKVPLSEAGALGGYCDAARVLPAGGRTVTAGGAGRLT